MILAPKTLGYRKLDTDPEPVLLVEGEPVDGLTRITLNANVIAQLAYERGALARDAIRHAEPRRTGSR